MVITDVANQRFMRTTYMKVIPRKVHGVLDYVLGITLIAAPWIFGFADGGLATQVPVIMGCAILIYSLFTKYEMGLFKIIPFNVHMIMDCLGGVLLAASPWLLGYAHYIYLPHLIVGIVEILVAVMTETRAEAGAMSQTQTPHIRHT